MPEHDAWESAVAAIWADAGDLSDAEVVARIEVLAQQRPGTAAATYELASAYDYAGREGDAEPLYRAALQAGLTGDRHPCAVIQLASTIRNLGRPEESVALLAEPLPDRFVPAQAAFTALALVDLGREREGAVTALRALAGLLPNYARAVTSYADELADPPR